MLRGLISLRKPIALKQIRCPTRELRISLRCRAFGDFDRTR
jgi:hypothetical protein